MRYLITGIGKGTYNSGNPITASNVWKTYSKIPLADLEQSGATDGQPITWNASLGRYAPGSVLGSKWTDSGSDIFRNSKVSIGSASILDGQLGIKQNSGAIPALLIEGMSSSRSIISSVKGLGGVERYKLDNWGFPTWVLRSDADESGRLSFSTPNSTAASPTIGVLTFYGPTAPMSERGGIVWNPLNTNGASDSCKISTRGVDHLGISATGRFRFGSSYFSGASFSFTMVSGDTLIARWVSGGVGRFAIHDDDGIQTDNLISSVAHAWKLGSKIDAAVSLDTTKYLSVQVAGVEYKLALANV